MSRISQLDIEASLHGVQASIVATNLLGQLTLSLPRLAAGGPVPSTVPGRAVRLGGSPFGLARTVPGLVPHPPADGIAVHRPEVPRAPVDKPVPAGGPLQFDVVITTRSNPFAPRVHASPAVTRRDDDASSPHGSADTVAGSHTRDLSVRGGHDPMSGAHGADLIAPHGAPGPIPDLILSYSRDVVVRTGRHHDVRLGSGPDTLDGRSGGRSDTLMGGGAPVQGGGGRDTVGSAGGDPHSPSGRTRADGASASNDTIFGASAQEQVRLAQPSRTLDITRTTHDADGSTTIHIVSGLGLASGDVRLDVDDHRHHPASSPTLFNKLH